jgi:uncharacterized phage-associated protein
MNDRHNIHGSTASEGSIELSDAASTGREYITRGRRSKVRLSDVTADVAAKWIIEFCREHGDLISNLKLQKLLYYSQAWYLALHGKRLFPDDFEAWIRGPAQPGVYAKYKQYGSGPVDVSTPAPPVPPSIKKHIREVFEVYGGFSAYDLERLSCEEEPWREARGGIERDAPCDRVIDAATMKRFYEAKLSDGKRG